MENNFINVTSNKNQTIQLQHVKNQLKKEDDLENMNSLEYRI
jgi:hypothetical protein